MPTLANWLHIFFLPALVAIGVTFGLLLWHSRKDLTGTIDDGISSVPLSPQGKRAAIGILLAAGVLLFTSYADRPLGPPTCIAALLVLLVVSLPDFSEVISAVRDVSWGVLPLVAGLFVLVGALNHAGALPLAVAALHHCARWPVVAGTVAAAFSAGAASNVLNNLPVGLIGASALHAAGVSSLLHGAVLLGIDLGPNLSVTGSLATILWMIALRRENINVSAGSFLRVGLLVMPPVLLLSVLALVLSTR